MTAERGLLRARIVLLRADGVSRKPLKKSEPANSDPYPCFLPHPFHESRRPAVRLRTGLPAAESRSAQK